MNRDGVGEAVERAIRPEDPRCSLPTEAVEEIKLRIAAAEAKGYARAVAELTAWLEDYDRPESGWPAPAIRALAAKLDEMDAS